MQATASSIQSRHFATPYSIFQRRQHSARGCFLQVGAQTETELKEKKLRVEDALNATKAAVEEGIVIGGGCTLLRLATKVNAIRDSLQNEEQKVC